MQLPCNLDAERLLEHLREAAVVVDDGHHVRYANQAAEKLFARPVDGLLGHRLDPGAADSGKVVIHRGDAGDAYAEAESLPIELDGKPGRVLLLHDVTELVNKHNRLRKALKMEAVGRLTAGVTHDFNNKLTIINGFVNLALSQVNEDHNLFTPLQEIARAADHSTKMVAQLLSLGRTENAPAEPVRIHDLLIAMTESLKTLAGDGVELKLDLAATTAAARVDPVQLEQAVNNLVVNAGLAMEGRGTLTISTDTVDVSHEYAHCEETASGEHIVLSIADTGCGMDAETRDHIFEPFFTTRARGEGTGLGLAMVHGFAVQNEGHVTVESAPGAGTTFNLLFPTVAQAQEAPARESMETTFNEPQPETTSATILLAEDEPAIRLLLVQVLQTQGYNVLAGADGREALDKAEQFGGDIDLLITDVVMPNMCGRTLADELRKQRPETRHIYISGYSQGVIDADTAAAEGAVLLRKPFSPEQLLETVSHSLQTADVS
jgi:two-component system, cell cycle sensor histidine kinase and response regulator CckA